MKFEDDPRLAEFKKFRVAHRTITEVFEEIMFATSVGDRNRLIFVSGPSGVGKTALLDALVEAVEQQMAPLLVTDRECIPSAKVEAPAPQERRDFDYSGFIRSLLVAFHEIGVDEKLPLESLKEQALYRSRSFRSTAAGRMEALENVLRHRRPRFVLVDEAHSMTMTSGKNEERHFASLKGLVNKTATPFVLAGTYQLLTYGDLEPEILRRRTLIHFPRYVPTVQTDVDDFRDAIQELTEALPLPIEADLSDDLDFTFVGSLGCVGLLKDWLVSAATRAMRANRKSLKIDQLQQSMLPEPDRAKMFQAILRGEEALEDWRCRNRFSALDLRGKAKFPSLTQRTEKGRPGKRLPKRDPLKPDDNSGSN